MVAYSLPTGKPVLPPSCPSTPPIAVANSDMRGFLHVAARRYQGRVLRFGEVVALVLDGLRWKLRYLSGVSVGDAATDGVVEYGCGSPEGRRV